MEGVLAPERERPRSGRARDRNAYFDLLRGIALIRVITYHTVQSAWLHIAFPAIGLMFALAGALMARSLDRRGALRVVGSRMRRLLPPVWLYGAVALTLGWEITGQGGAQWSRLLFWVVPLRDPHESARNSGLVDTLWYLRTYLWFLLLSPVLLWAFRRARILVLVAPVTLLPLVALGGAQWPGRGLVANILTYGSCWLLGFAECDGLLESLSAWACGLLAATMAAAGLALELSSPADGLNDIGASTIGYALWSLACVLLLMRWRPNTSWLHRIPWLDQTVTVVNARAVSIYLWHDSAIIMTAALLGLAGLHVAGVVELPIVLVLTAIVVLMVGWVEDLAAQRRPALLPRTSMVTRRHLAAKTRPRDAQFRITNQRTNT